MGRRPHGKNFTEQAPRIFPHPFQHMSTMVIVRCVSGPGPSRHIRLPHELSRCRGKAGRCLRRIGVNKDGHSGRLGLGELLAPTGPIGAGLTMSVVQGKPEVVLRGHQDRF